MKVKKSENIKYLPHVFTEEGVSMLSSVLLTEVAEEVSVKIIRTFVKLRKIVSNNLIEQKYINGLVIKDHERINRKFNKKSWRIKMNELIEKENIEAMIYEVRGVYVMLDSDLARLYHCTNGTKAINLAVRRNKNRFPEDFYFQLTNIEYNSLKFHFETSKKIHGGVRKLPYVFTEQGVSMLSSVLHTEVAEEVSVKIIRTFVKLRKIVSNNLIEQKYINNMVFKHDEEIKVLQETFNKLNEKQKINKIFYNGQVYDAYSLLIDILNKSKKEIIIIDNYAGKQLLDILKDINKKIIIITSNIDEILKNKYEKQYNNVTFIKNDTFHDRFIIIDKKILYECGSSFKNLGKKCFHIGEITEKELIESLIKKLEI